jgi:hypothetical protein
MTTNPYRMTDVELVAALRTAQFNDEMQSALDLRAAERIEELGRATEQTEDPADIELIRRCLSAGPADEFRDALQVVEQRIVDLRTALDQARRVSNPIYATLYFTDDEMEPVCRLLDDEIDGIGMPEFGPLNAFRTALREAQFSLRLYQPDETAEDHRGDGTESDDPDAQPGEEL